MSATTLRYTTWLLATLIGFPVLWGQPATYVVTTICLVFGFALAHGVESGSRRAFAFAAGVTGGWLLASATIILSMDVWAPWLIDHLLPVLGGDGRHEGLFVAAVVSVLMLGMGLLVAALGAPDGRAAAHARRTGPYPCMAGPVFLALAAGRDPQFPGRIAGHRHRPVRRPDCRCRVSLDAAPFPQ